MTTPSQKLPAPESSPEASSATGGAGRTSFAQRLNVAAMGLLIAVLLLYLMRQFATVLQQLFIAGAIAYLVLPLNFWLVRRRIPAWLSYLIVASVFLGATYGLGQIAYSSFSELASSIPRYQQSLSGVTERIADRIPGVDHDMLHQVVVGQSASIDSIIGMIRSAVGTFFSFLTTAIVVLVYLFFFVAEQFSFRRRIEAAFEHDRAERIMAIVRKINQSIIQYVAIKTLMSLLTGILTFLVLLLLGIDYAMLWGVVAFLLNYIPYVGSAIAMLLPTALALVTREDPWWALVTFLSLGTVQTIVAYIVEPRVAGGRLNLSPLVILLALAFGAAVWGIVGMILAVPIIVAVKAVLENIEDTRPIAVMMSHIRK